ncbi:MAG: carbohydrate ABC transporter permease [Phototrophicaceae bacterium]|jgi:putative chitobiose transport system permease protein
MAQIASALTEKPRYAEMTAMERRRNVAAYLFLLPALGFLTVFVFIPLIQVVYYSFTDYDLLTAPQWVGLTNYSNLLQDAKFWEGMAKSFTYLLVTPVLIGVSLTLAIVVNRKLPGIGIYRALYYIPVVISTVAIGMIFEFVFADNGLINGVLREVGFIQRPIHFLTDPDTILGSIMAVTVWRGIGYYMMMFLAGLQAIPEELYEAAAIDGATRWQQHLYITVPQLRPVITFVTVISSIAALRAFDEIFILTDGSGGLLDAGLTAIFYLYRQGFEFLNIGYAAAIAVIFTLITLALSVVNLRFLEGN